jgi:uncharacterized protein (TIGR00661 family)
LYKKRAVLSVSEKINITILVAPLDWGLGHATRCIPLIRHLISTGCNVIIATEGAQEKLLKQEFPLLEFVHLPGYNIRYANNKRFFALKILAQLPNIIVSIYKEKKWLKKLLNYNKIDAVISDNRYGLHNKNVDSIIITHQLTIKAPVTFAQNAMRFFNYKLLEKFKSCWVPDFDGKPNLAGILSHPTKLPVISTRYIGAVSRFDKKGNNEIKFDVLVVISGPEPQRTTLEQKLLLQLQDFKGKVMFVRGLPKDDQFLQITNTGIQVKNHLTASEMEQAFLESEIVISRSGYTTVMDICKLQKKSILIPTPGQTEQEYLAKHLQEQGWCVMANQENFQLKKQLERLDKFQFKMPELDMEAYKVVLDEFVASLKK